MAVPKSGPASELFKSTMLGVMMNLMRTSTMAMKVDISRVVSFVSDSWDRMYGEGVLDLAPLYETLMATGQVTQSEVAAVLLFLKKREVKLGVTVKLPLQVERLPEATRHMLVEALVKNGVQSGVTMVGLNRVKDRPSAPPAAAPANLPPPAPFGKPATGSHAAAGLTDRVRGILHGDKDRKDG